MVSRSSDVRLRWRLSEARHALGDVYESLNTVAVGVRAGATDAPPAHAAGIALSSWRYVNQSDVGTAAPIQLSSELEVDKPVED